MTRTFVATIRTIALGVVLTMMGTGSAQSQTVTITGSGTIMGWAVSTTTLPEALQAAFPIGAPFSATFTYDPSLVDTVFNHGETLAAHWAPVTSLTASAAGHAVTPIHSPGPAWVLNDAPQGGAVADAIQGDLPVLIDGSETTAGNQIRLARMSLFNLTGRPLSSLALPTEVCLGDWDNLSLVLFFVDPQATQTYQLIGRGTPDRSIDSDNDGVSDGVERLHACINACAGNTDADGDTVFDRVEIDGGTDPCSPDTDGDGLLDGADPLPLVPGISNDRIVEIGREIAAAVLNLDESAFDGPNTSAARGRRNALANRLHAAANQMEAGNFAEALSILEHVLSLLDGEPAPPDVMDDVPAKDMLREQVEELIALIRAGLR